MSIRKQKARKRAMVATATKRRADLIADGHRRIDIIVSPECGQCLDRIKSTGLNNTQAVETAVIKHAKGLK